MNSKIYQTPVISSWPVPVTFKEAFSDGRKRKGSNKKREGILNSFLAIFKSSPNTINL